MRSIKTILAGLVVLLAAAILLFWNEARSFTEERGLKEGEAVVNTVTAASIDPGNEGKLVNLTGKSGAAEPLQDDELNIEVEGLRLTRKVEMFQ